MRIMRGSAVILVVLLAGVAFGQIPSQWRPKDEISAETAPLPPVPMAEQFQGETLEEAFRAALSSDHRIDAGRWNVTSSESTWASARAQRLPSLTFGADYYALSDQPAFHVDLAPLPISTELPFANKDSGGFQSVVAQPLYTSGRISSGIDAAQSQVQAQQADLCRTVLDVKINVAEAYVSVLRAARLVEVAQAKVTSLAGHRQDVASLFDKGVVSKNDFLSADVALADAQQQALDAHNRLEIARSAYNRAVGRPFTTPVRLAELYDDGDRCDLDVIIAQAVRERPEVAALAAQARALQHQSDAERAKCGPQVQVLGGYGYQQNSYVDPNGVAGVLLGVQWNAIDMGRAGNAARALSDRAEATMRLRREAESIIALEVRQRWLELETARQRVAFARQATAKADENLRVARDRYQNQVGTNTEVLDAETLRVQAYNNLFDSTYQAVLASLRLHRAAGNL